MNERHCSVHCENYMHSESIWNTCLVPKEIISVIDFSHRYVMINSRNNDMEQVLLKDSGGDMRAHTHTHNCPRRPEEVIRVPGAGVIGGNLMS